MPKFGDSTGIYIGTNAATVVYVGATKVWPTTVAVVAPTYVQGVVTPYSVGTNGPSATFAAGVQTGDVVYFYMSTTAASTALAASTPAGWVNVLGGTTKVSSDANTCVGVYHVVTSGENGTTVFTCTGLFTNSNTGNLLAVVIRGVNPTTPLDGSGSTFDSNNATPHVLAAIPGAGGLLNSNSLVVSGVSKDLPGSYATSPASHTMRLTSNVVTTTWLGTRNAATVANTDVAATNITPDVGDEYCAISVAFAGI